MATSTSSLKIEEPAARDPRRVRPPFRPDIEGVRGIAILLVVAYHAGVPGFGGGYVGVDVFFVLSGYLITWLLVREIELTGRLNLKDFFARRVRRLLPALALMLVVVMPITFLVYSPIDQATLPETAIATATYVSNLYFARLSTDYLGAGADLNPLLHTWSLSVEEQFYLAWPFLVILGLGAWGARHRPGGPRTLLILLGGCAVLSFGLSVWLTAYRQPWAFFISPTRAWEFAIGGLAVLVWRPPESGTSAPSSRTIRIARPVIATAGLGCIILAALAFSEATPFPGVAALLPTVGTAMVLVAASYGTRDYVGRLLESRILQESGRLSYSWYLWHWPVLVFAAVALGEVPLWARIGCVLLGLGMAEASYRWVENPLRRSPLLGRRPAYSFVLAGAVTLFGVTTAAGWRAASTWAGTLPDQSAITQAKAHRPEVYEAGCIAGYFTVEARECEFGDRDSSTTIVLFGDSHAAQWFTPVREIARERGWRLVTLIKSACPPADVEFFYGAIGRTYSECPEWRHAAFERVAELMPDAVIATGSFAYASASSARPLVKHDEWRQGTVRTFQHLASSSGQVIHIRDNPRPGFDVAACLSRQAWTGRWLGAEACEFERSGSVGQDVYRIELEAAAGISAVRSLDLTGYICPENVCEPMRGGLVIYRDTNHLSDAFAASMATILSPHLTEAIGELRRRSTPVTP